MFGVLNVYLKNRFCGQLSWESERNRYLFRYDADAKNYSVVYRGRRPVLAPLYDAVSTVVYPDLSREFAMSIGGEMRLGSLTRAHFVRLAEDCGLSPKLVLSRLDALAARILPAADRTAEELATECPSPVYGEIRRVIAGQVAAVG